MTPPLDLSPTSQARWSGLVADLAAVHGGTAIVDLDLLADILRAADRLEAVSAAVTRDGVTVEGSKGQLRPHPLLAVEANLRREVAAGLERLGLAPRLRDYRVRVGRNGRLRND